jgi:hypothetical protein
MDIARDDVARALDRIGYRDLAALARSELPDPVPEDEALRWCDAHGITRGLLIDRMGGSP